MKQGKEGSGLRKWQVDLDRFLSISIAGNVPYIILYCFLAILLIGNNNYATDMIRVINEQQQQMKELKWKHTDLQAKVMNQTSESQMIKLTEAIGLKPLEHPVFEIRIVDTTNKR